MWREPILIADASVAQSVEQLIRNQQVRCSSHPTSSKPLNPSGLRVFLFTKRPPVSIENSNPRGVFSFQFRLPRKLDLQFFLQIDHIRKLYPAFVYWVIVMINEEVLHDMRALKSALLIERNRQRAVSCANLQNCVPP